MCRGVKKWDRNNFDVNNIFAFQVVLDIIQNDDDPEPQNMNECRQINDWHKWREAMQAELHSLIKRDVFGPVVQTPARIKPVGNKWVFARKRNENNDIIRYKARLVAQGFSQRSCIDYEETYSPVIDAITFRFLISLAVSEELDMRLMDVITTYLYGDECLKHSYYTHVGLSFSCLFYINYIVFVARLLILCMFWIQVHWSEKSSFWSNEE